MQIKTRSRNNWTIFDLSGKLNEITSKTLANEVEKKLTAGENKILFNFNELDFINSSGLGSLISISKRVNQAKGQLRFYNLQPFVSDLFNITKLHNVFSIYSTEDEAAS